MAVWLVLALAAGVRTLSRPASHTVFPIFVAGAERYWADQPLYDEQPGLDYFRYPPAFAVAITPLSRLGLRLGGTLWAWLSCAVLLVGLWRFLRDVLPPAWSEQRSAVFLVLGALGALPGIWNGQSNALVVGLLLLGAVEVVRQNWWRAAFLLAPAVAIKLTPIVPALLLCALWPRRLAPRLLIVLVLLALVPFLTRPPEIVLQHYRDWLGQLTHLSGKRWGGFRDAWTVWEVVRHPFIEDGAAFPLAEHFDSAPYRALQVLTGAATLAWCLWLSRTGSSPRRLVNLTLAMGCAWLMLFGPAVEHATYVFLAAPLSWALLERAAWPRGRWLAWAAFVLVMVFGWGSLTRPFVATLPVVLLALPIGTALFIVWLIGYATRHEPARNSASRNSSMFFHTSRTALGGLTASLPSRSRKA